MKYSAILLTSALVLATGCGDDSPTAPPASVAPTVTATVPVTAANGVPRNASVTATFSQAMTASTLNSTTFELRDGATVIPASVTYSRHHRDAGPTSALAPNTAFTATISTGARNAAGTGLAATARPGASRRWRRRSTARRRQPRHRGQLRDSGQVGDLDHRHHLRRRQRGIEPRRGDVHHRLRALSTPHHVHDVGAGHRSGPRVRLRSADTVEPDHRRARHADRLHGRRRSHPAGLHRARSR